MFFTLFIATHASILASDFSSKFYNLPSKKYRTFRYHFHLKFAVSVNILSLYTFSARQNWINELLRFL